MVGWGDQCTEWKFPLISNRFHSDGLPDALHGQRVAVDVQQGPDWTVDRQTGQVTTHVVIVDEQSEIGNVESYMSK